MEPREGRDELLPAKVARSLLSPKVQGLGRPSLGNVELGTHDEERRRQSAEIHRSLGWAVEVGVGVGLAHGEHDVKGAVGRVGADFVVDDKNEGRAGGQAGDIPLGGRQDLELRRRRGGDIEVGVGGGADALLPRNRIPVVALRQKAVVALPLLAVIFLSASPLNAAIKPTIHKSTITTNIPIRQNLKFETHPTVPTTDNAVTGRLLLATKDLQVKDSPSDVSCPVKLLLSGSVTALSDPNNDSLRDIESSQDITDLLTSVDLNTHGVVVSKILFCDGPTIAYGCGITANLMIFSSDAAALWDQVTAAHEFGHYQGLGHVADANRIMNGKMDTQAMSGNEDHVTSGECNAFKKPL